MTEANIRFDGQVAIVTGAGGGLGRSHALALAARGAKVVVNDLGGARDGEGGSIGPAETVVGEIEAAGGEAISDGASVSDRQAVGAMVEAAMARWGRVDILVNNAGILRDKSFAKMEMADFEAVIGVHLIGSANCAHALWPIMREQGYGRIVFTASPSGLYGQFGQANYAAAKSGMIGLMNALHLEGRKNDIRVNLLAPTARTRMTEDLGIPAPVLEQLTPEAITTGLLFLVSREAPSRAILSCGGGSFTRAYIGESEGVHLPEGERTPEALAAAWEAISDPSTLKFHKDAMGPTTHFLAKAHAAGRKN